MDHSIIPSSSSSSSKRPREEDYAPAASSDLNAIDNDTSSPSATAVNKYVLGPSGFFHSFMYLFYFILFFFIIFSFLFVLSSAFLVNQYISIV